MRNIYGVRQAILNVIPDEEIRDRLAGVTEVTLRAVPYKAPEQMPEVWALFARNLSDIVGAPRPGTWRQTVADIFNGTQEYLDWLREDQRQALGLE